MPVLSTYITQVRRLLHDVSGAFWTDSELTSYINMARDRLVRDTGCLRTIQSSATVTNQETYTFSSLPSSTNTVDIININLYWGNTRVPMRYLPWTQFNAELRFWQNYIGRPVAFTMYGPQTFYLGPVPDQVYTLELDTVISPNDLVDDTTVEQIPDPWTEPVKYYAAHQAKYQEQSYGESEIFKQEYVKQVQQVLASTFTRRMPDPYSSPY